MTLIQLVEAFEDRGTLIDGLAYLDGNRCPEFDVDFDCMARDPECLSKMRGPEYDAQVGLQRS